MTTRDKCEIAAWWALIVLIMALVVLSSKGCTVATYTTPEGGKAELVRIGYDTTVDGFEFEQGADGKVSVRLKKATSNEKLSAAWAEAMKILLEASKP